MYRYVYLLELISKKLTVFTTKVSACTSIDFFIFSKQHAKFVLFPLNYGNNVGILLITPQWYGIRLHCFWVIQTIHSQFCCMHARCIIDLTLTLDSMTKSPIIIIELSRFQQMGKYHRYSFCLCISELNL